MGALALAWLVLIAGVAPAAAGSDSIAAETAAIPIAPRVASDGLPALLPAEDAQLYREIFALQEKGKWRAADKKIKRLGDRRLMGHVLAQRYLHPTAYRSKYKELRDWMGHYADHPDARRIYKLALKRRPKNYKRPKAPEYRRGTLAPRSTAAPPYRSTKQLGPKGRRVAKRLKRQVRRNVLRTRLSVTERLLESPKANRYLDQVEIDDGYARVAAAWFYYGRDAKAYDLADAAAARSSTHVPMAHWTAGLAAWRLGLMDEAAAHFEHLALSENVSGWNAAAGAYWAARVHLRQGRPGQMSEWLTRAAAHPRTFYGLLARRALGLEPRLRIQSHRVLPTVTARLAAEPAGARALALLQVGQRLRAERELKGLRGPADVDLVQGLIAVAEHAQMSELSFRLAHRFAHAGSDEAAYGALDAALYPIPPWRPKSGFAVDRALVYALIRQESGFNVMAKSPDGARGLMQLMPRTARFMARHRKVRHYRRNKLFDPAINMELGQGYVAHLQDLKFVGADLFRLAVAYNGGPGNLARWERKMNYDGDPLLFIESIPSRETRVFVERVLTNLWVYRLRLGQPAPSLDALAAGKWPLYVALDTEAPELASNGSN